MKDRIYITDIIKEAKNKIDPRTQYFVDMRDKVNDEIESVRNDIDKISKSIDSKFKKRKILKNQIKYLELKIENKRMLISKLNGNIRMIEANMCGVL